MTDRYDTLAHWLAFDLETIRLQRRAKLIRELTAIRHAFAGVGDTVKRTLLPLIQAFPPPKTRADYVLWPPEKRHR